MPRLTVLDRMTLSEKLAESKRFWESESEALFPPTLILHKGLSAPFIFSKSPVDRE